MRNYNQQIEDAYASSKRRGDLMRNRAIERSSSQDRRNRYRDDKYQVPIQQPFKDDYRRQEEWVDEYNDNGSRFRGNTDYEGEPYRGNQGDRRRSDYPETYRSAMSGYSSEHVGRDLGRRDYNTSYGEGGNLYGSGFGLHRGKGPKNYKRSDDRIREDINDRLTDDPYIDASAIDVAVQNGEVILTGTVVDRAEKRRAEDLVESVSGVGDIENRIKIKQGAANDDNQRNDGREGGMRKSMTA